MHRTAREEAKQACANIKEATDREEAPPTDSEARQCGRGERRPGSVANFKARDLCGRLRGPRVAWLTSRPASCMADMRPVQAVAECKHKRKGAGVEVEEVQAGRALPTPTTWHLRRRSRTGNTRRASRQERRVHIITSNFCFKRIPGSLSKR